MSLTSDEGEPSLCGTCEEAVNVLGHLEDSVPCREATMRAMLPRQWWIERYFDDTDLLVLDLSLAKSCCLNTGGCPLPQGIIERYSRHPFDNENCLRFYKTAPIFARLNIDASDTAALKNFLRARKKQINKAKTLENQSFREEMASQMKDTCRRCGLQGPVLSGFELRSEVRGDQRMLCVKPLCEDEVIHVDFHPRALTSDRKTASRPIDPRHNDHFVAFRVPCKAGLVIGPAQLISDRYHLPSDERIDGEESIVVLVPNTIQAMGKGGLEMASMRASEEWANLRRLANATIAPRPMLLNSLGEFVQAASVLQRTSLAAFRRCLSDKLFALRNSARGRLETSPNKTDATFSQPSFRDVAPGAVEETFRWSNRAEATRHCESGARSAVNGKIKTKVRVRLLTDDPALWSDDLKKIMVRSYQRDAREKIGGGLELTCQGGCDPDNCGENHLNVDGYLQERFSGIRRLQGIPLLLNYLKAKVEFFRRKVLVPECHHYDFNIEWDRDTFDVHMVGHLWMSKRRSFNEKMARNWYLGDVNIVSRILKTPQALETVSLDSGHLERR